MSKLKMQSFQPLEKDIQKSCIDYLRAKGYFVWKEHSGGLMVNRGQDQFMMPIGLRGKSDILGITKEGKFLAIEVKRRSGIVSEEQQHFINEINRHGGIAFVAHSIDEIIAHGL